jgi:hypothetical protein
VSYLFTNGDMYGLIDVRSVGQDVDTVDGFTTKLLGLEEPRLRAKIAVHDPSPAALGLSRARTFAQTFASLTSYELIRGDLRARRN